MTMVVTVSVVFGVGVDAFPVGFVVGEFVVLKIDEVEAFGVWVWFGVGLAGAVPVGVSEGEGF